jgi:hypothetical protein
MPTVREYKDRAGFYIVANAFGPIATFQVSSAGNRWLKRHDYGHDDTLSRNDFQRLHDSGHVFTGGGGVDYQNNGNGGIHPSSSWRRNAERTRLRRRSSIAKMLFQEAFPGNGVRGRVLRLIAKTIGWAHAINPRAWSTTLSDDDRVFLRLNVGKLDVFACSRDGEVMILVHKPLIDLSDLWDLRAEHQLGRLGQFKSRPRAIPIHLPASTLRARYPLFEDAHQHVVCSMAYLMDGNPYTRAHSPGVLRHLRKEGFAIQDPAYV